MLYKKILLAIAGRDSEGPVIAEAARVTRECGGKLEVLHVNDTHAGEMSLMAPYAGHKFTKKELQGLFSTNVKDADLLKQTKFTVMTSENHIGEIIKAAQGRDLLILGHRRMPFLQAMLTDSTDEKIANQSPCPVLVVPEA
jgi:nucleotide-binding universal stress UspA family protein